VVLWCADPSKIYNLRVFIYKQGLSLCLRCSLILEMNLVQVLKLTYFPPNFQSSAKMPEILCTFHNLKSLKLKVHFYKQHPIMLTLYLLKSAPNLEELKLKVIINFPILIFIFAL
jgi:hypothetical protein